jgi:hypothetical protein
MNKKKPPTEMSEAFSVLFPLPTNIRFKTDRAFGDNGG